ncbi:DUF1559 domain-containing protein [Alienimonas sp. DA493]|uniref:DUF1559 family PulG-like putative transporter n=1 Tax=Alienimonas sp. DA493 TaxID=3373605 RepID=UPI0037552BA5
MPDFAPLPASLLTPLLWVAVQVTAVTLAAAGLHAAASRFGPRGGGRVALLGLCAAAALSLAALSPWPRWDGGAVPSARPNSAAPAKPQAEIGNERTDADFASVSLAAGRAFVAALLDPPGTLGPVADAAAPREVRRPVRWGMLLAGGLTLLGLGRFVVGWLWVGRLRRRSEPVDDVAVQAEFAALRRAAGAPDATELRATTALSTAAAVGWRRPAVLLPTGWRRWAPADRRAVLAHELAHVARRDAAANLLAQSALLTQFYHPLSHWLAGRLRLDQELAADAAAAELCGGRAAYLRSLAAVALTADTGPVRPRSPASVAWPARAFLPSRRTLHQRVEMLRRTPVPRPRWATRTAGPLAAAGVLAVALLASGFRPAPAAAQAPAGLQPPAERQPSDSLQPPDSQLPGVLPPARRPVVRPPVSTDALAPRRATPTAEAADVLSYVPADAQLVAVLEAQALLTDPALAPVAALLRGEGTPDGLEAQFRTYFGLSFADVERVAMYQNRLAEMNGGSGERPTPPTFVIRTVGEAPDPAVEVEGGAVPAPEAPVTKADARTLLFSPGGSNDLGTKPARSFAGNPLLNAARANGAGAALYVDLAAVRPAMLAELNEAATRPGSDAGVQALALGLARPLATNVDRVAVWTTLEPDGTVRATALAEAPDEAAASVVKATVDAALTMAGNALDAAPALTDGEPGEQMGVAMAVGMARKILAATTVSAQGPRVTLTTRADNSAPMLIALILPAIQSARAAARRTQSQNNLKQIALAMHNYHDVYKRFPPAVVVENGVKRSWRVELLPFLEHADLYEAYDKTKPWDDPANAAVLARTPDVYRHPADDRGKPFTSYVAPIGAAGGPPSLWTAQAAPQDGGTGFRDVTDGTSNTIMVLETKTEIPWTKPEDVTVDLSKSVDPTPFGGWHRGGFNAAFTDGAVRFLSERIDATLFKNVLTRAGGEVIDLP